MSYKKFAPPHAKIYTISIYNIFRFWSRSRGKSVVGKTTLLKIIGLLEAPVKGQVKIIGRSVEGLGGDELSRMRLHHIGFIFQFFNLLPSLTVLEKLELPLALAGAK